MTSIQITNRRQVLRILAALVLVNGGLSHGLCPVFADKLVAPPSKPNIVFVLADDK